MNHTYYEHTTLMKTDKKKMIHIASIVKSKEYSVFSISGKTNILFTTVLSCRLKSAIQLMRLLLL